MIVAVETLFLTAMLSAFIGAAGAARARQPAGGKVLLGKDGAGGDRRRRERYGGRLIFHLCGKPA